ncbi:MAG TPA: glycosyltransferase [Clostridiaceae bacterium]|nr:glycosyltransferase [Clostridiaceae bacterium]
MYSIIIPCYNSSKTIENVVESTIIELKKLNINSFEFILVNDDSPDCGETLSALKTLNQKYSNVEVIDLMKNSGQHMATFVGMQYAEGDYIISMDDDMQTNPSEIKFLIEELEKGYDIVYGFYKNKKHSIIRNIFSFFSSLSTRILIKRPRKIRTSSFWIARKKIVELALDSVNTSIFLPAQFMQVTNRISCVPIKHFDRKIGESNYTFKKLLFQWSCLLSYSTVLLRISFGIGLFLLLLSAVFFVICFLKLLKYQFLHLFSFWMWLTLLLFALVFIIMGILGDYIGRISNNITKKRQISPRAIYNKRSNSQNLK